MRDFPTVLAAEPTALSWTNTDESLRTLLQTLEEKGFYVQLGITIADIPDLQALATQPSIKKYCPKDCKERFRDKATVETWLHKARLTFLLKERNTDRLAGIAWTGPGTSSKIPSGKLTGGIRISEGFQGRGLATPFLEIALLHTQAEYSAEQMWFECWKSNAGAFHIYQKLGFSVVESEESQRETPTGGHEADTRVYMKLTKEK